MERADPVSELALLIRTRHPLITIETVEEGRAFEFVMRACHRVNLHKFRWSVTRGLHRTRPQFAEPVMDTEEPRRALAHLLHGDLPGIYVFADLMPHLTTAVDQRLLREVVEHAERKGQTIILIEQRLNLPPALERLAVPFDLALPDEAAIRDLASRTFKEIGEIAHVKVEIKRSELDDLLRNLRGLTTNEVRRAIWRAALDDGRIDSADVKGVLQLKQEKLREGGMLEYIEPGIKLDDIGGLARLKDWLRLRERALTPEAREFGLAPPRGILLLGVQGAGKSMCARAVAAAWNLPLLRMDPGALYDKYVGESEKQLRRALRTAEAMAPLVLWIDEIEKGFASAASQSTDGGLSQRMFGTLLSWMQDNRAPIFLVATANDISALPPELMRKGRFDEIFFVDLPDAPAREQILSVHLERRKRDPKSFDLKALAAASDGFSGAELEQAIVSALYAAFAAGTELSTQGLLDELGRTRAISVTMAERIAELRGWAADRCVPAN